MCRKVPKKANKERHELANNQTNANSHIHIYTNEHPNKKTTKAQLRTANTDTNSHGRMLAEGDVDLATGSPKEPCRL